MNEPYENTLSIEQLRQEVRKLWDEQQAFNQALIDLPEVPPIDALGMLASVSMNLSMNLKGFDLDLQGIGKALQRSHEGVPFQCEYETAAGLWSIIRQALLDRRAVAK